MFHLFGKTYLEFDFLYTSLHPAILASDKYLEDPLYPDEMTNHQALDKLLELNYNSSLESFWEDLVLKGEKNRFYLYSDVQDYHKLQLQYWKSTLCSPSFETCYFLHKIHLQDFMIKNHFYSDNVEGRVRYSENKVSILSEDEYRKLYDKTEISLFIKSLPVEKRSFEMLLANYLESGVESKTYNCFFDKLKIFCWKLLISEIEILKGDMINGVYDFAKKSFKFDNFEQSVESLLHLIKSDQSLMWVLDENISGADFEYVKSRYDCETFINFIKMQSEIYSKGPRSSENDFEDKVVDIIRYVFDDDYLSVLKLDINKGFGSYLFNNSNGHKVNLLLVSYLYDLYRDQNREEIKRFVVA